MVRDTDSARLHFEAALASGALDGRQRERALEGLRLARGGEQRPQPGADTPAVPAEGARVAALEARVEAAIAAGRTHGAAAFEAIDAAYRDPDAPHLGGSTRARLLFAHAATTQLAGRTAEAISLWEEAIGSGLLDAEHVERARDYLHLARADRAAPARPADLLLAMIDGAVALQSNPLVARDMLLRAYRNPGFTALGAQQRGRCLYNLAASYSNLGESRAAVNFWLEALNSGGLDERQRAQANDHIRAVMPGASSPP